MRMCSEENFNQLSGAISRIERYLGTTKNPEETTLTYFINSLKEGLKSLENQSFGYDSIDKKLNHYISHNLNSNFLEVNVMRVGENDILENVLCDVRYSDKNTIEIDLCEKEKLIVTIRRIN